MASSIFEKDKLSKSVDSVYRSVDEILALLSHLGQGHLSKPLEEEVEKTISLLKDTIKVLIASILGAKITTITMKTQHIEHPILFPTVDQQDLGMALDLANTADRSIEYSGLEEDISRRESFSRSRPIGELESDESGDDI